ncbi:MAG: Uma2 family endonuclease [Cyanobacteria bacterium J06621_8]
MLVKESEKELISHQEKLDKIIKKLQQDLNLSSPLVEKRYTQIAYEVLLEICKKIIFIKNNKDAYRDFNCFRQNIISKLDEIAFLAQKLESIAGELNGKNEVVNEAIVICDFVIIDLVFIISSLILDYDYKTEIGENLDYLEVILSIFEMTYNFSSHIKDNFILLVQKNYPRYIYFPVLIADKICDSEKGIKQKSLAYNVVASKISLLKRLDVCKEKAKLFTRTIIDCLKYPGVDADIIITLERTSFKHYQSISSILNNISWCKISYGNKILKLMCPGIKHENINRGIDTLIIAYCDFKEIDYILTGSATARNQKKEKGKEPDLGYIFSDLKKDRKIPDLAVEVNFSSGTEEDLNIYRGLGVKEVWMWNKNDILSFYLFIDEEYKSIDKSFYLEGITPKLISKYTSLIMSDKSKTRIIKKEFIAEISQDTLKSSS